MEGIEEIKEIMRAELGVYIPEVKEEVEGLEEKNKEKKRKNGEK